MTIEDKRIASEDRETSTHSLSLQLPTLMSPLMPAQMSSHVKLSGLQPMSMEVLPADIDIEQYASKTPVLKNVMFELTLACNLECIQCYCNAGKARSDELDTEEITRFIDYLAKTEADTITFTGGEPLLHKDFLAIAKHASNQGLDVALFTNGELLDHDILDAFLRMKVESIQISLDGARPETHDLIRGKRGLFEKTLHAIKESKQRGFPVVVMTTLVEQNKDEMIGISQLCEKLEVEGWCMNMFIPVGRAKDLNVVSLQTLSHIRKQIGVSPAVCGNTACGVGFQKIAVLSNGDICPCEVLQSAVLGNIRNTNLLDVFHQHPLMDNYRKSTVENIAECSICPVSVLCRGGCKSSALIRNGSIFSPDPTACYSWHHVVVRGAQRVGSTDLLSFFLL